MLKQANVEPKSVRSAIPFNKPYFTGKETEYIRQAVASGKISGDGLFTKKCHNYFQERYGFPKVLLTTSCTDALEMSALLLRIDSASEVIMPSFTFVSTANAFVLRGARIVFADSEKSTPNLDPEQIEPLITPRTKAIVVVHYAGMACDMDRILSIAQRHGIYVVEDAAQAIDSTYKKTRPLGSLGHVAAFSFHESKNIISGEGGMVVLNDSSLVQRAEILWEKGTNRAALFRGEVDKYSWLDIGSSFLPSEVTSAILYAQLESLDEIQNRRKQLWNHYYSRLRLLEEKGFLQLPKIPDHAVNNAHMFYVCCTSADVRTNLIRHLKEQNISAVFHYLPLHRSPYYASRHDGRELPNCDRFSDCLLRLPLFYELTESDVAQIVDSVNYFYGC